MRVLFSIPILIFFILSLQAKTPRYTTEQLLDVLNMEKAQMELINSYVEQECLINPSMTLVKEEYRKLLQKSIGWKSIKAATIKLWEKNFTPEEISELAAFYESPIGQKALLKMPEIYSEAIKVGNALTKTPAFGKEVKILDELFKKRLAKKKSDEAKSKK